MKYDTYSENYKTVRISYPNKWNLACPSCGWKVNYAYSGDGKIIHTLEGDIYQIVNFYSCSNQNCVFSRIVFNPSPRFDYSGRSYGADVFRLISEEFLIYNQKSDQISERMSKKYTIIISEATISRMCDDILKLKSLKIDEKTREIIHNQKRILLCLDGQDPGGNTSAIWCFLDLLSNRVLATYKFDSLDYMTLHRVIEEIKEYYGVEIIGWVSDKQNVIKKCHDMFYSDIPHQYCQFHFLKNTWNHLETFDSNIYMPLKKTITGLYIHTVPKNQLVYFENVGKESVKKVFKSIDDDLQVMAKARNKTFKELRGIWLYEKLTEYVGKMEKALETLDPSFRLTKILSKTCITLKKALTEVKSNYEECIELYKDFKQIREVLGNDKDAREVVEEKLNTLYEMIFKEAKKKNPELKLEECKSFLPGKNNSSVDIMGEWCRLWKSYNPGLFQYLKFPKPFKTISTLENGFSKEKQSIFARVAKGNVSNMVVTRGEDILRLKHCTLEELKSDIIEEYSDEVVKRLRASLRSDIKKETMMWRMRSRQYEGISIVIENYYQIKKEKNLILSGEMSL